MFSLSTNKHLQNMISLGKGSFTNYKDKCFFDHLPLSVDIFYLIKLIKRWHFWTIYPPLLVNVVCERPLRLLFSYCKSPDCAAFKAEISSFHTIVLLWNSLPECQCDGSFCQFATISTNHKTAENYFFVSGWNSSTWSKFSLGNVHKGIPIFGLNLCMSRKIRRST